MQIRILTIITTIILAGLVLSIKNRFFVEPSREALYYFTAFFLTSCMLIAVTTISLINLYIINAKAAKRSGDNDYTPNLREYYRIIYEPEKYPYLKIRHHKGSNVEYEFKVLDISEQGMRFLNDKNLQLEGIIQGRLCFPDRDTFQIEGEIIREQDDQVSLLLSMPIPYDKIIIEQRSIILESRFKKT